MTAGTDDYDEIVRVAQLYVDGFNDNDVSKFREAFHEDAWIFFIDADGGLRKHLISRAFEGWAAPQFGGRRSNYLRNPGRICCRGPTQLGRCFGRVQFVYRLLQSAQDQRGLEDHIQDRHS